MTLREVIELVRATKPNQYTDTQMVGWLSECDSAIYTEIIATHEAVPGMPDGFHGYTDADLDKQLLVKGPYEIMYRHFLESRIDLYNKETNNYNTTSALFNSAKLAYAAWYTQNYMPKGRASYFRL